MGWSVPSCVFFSGVEGSVHSVLSPYQAREESVRLASYVTISPFWHVFACVPLSPPPTICKALQGCPSFRSLLGKHVLPIISTPACFMQFIIISARSLDTSPSLHCTEDVSLPSLVAHDAVGCSRCCVHDMPRWSVKRNKWSQFFHQTVVFYFARCGKRKRGRYLGKKNPNIENLTPTVSVVGAAATTSGFLAVFPRLLGQSINVLSLF